MSSNKKAMLKQFLSRIGADSDEFSKEITKASEPDNLKRKMAMIGFAECMKLLVEGIKSVILNSPGRIDTISMKIFLSSIGNYTKLLTELLNEYDAHMGPMTSHSTALPYEDFDSNEFDDLIGDDIMDLFNSTKKNPSGSNSGGEKN